MSSRFGSTISQRFSMSRSLCWQSWSRAYCYVELTVSSLAVAEAIAGTHFAYARSWPGSLV